jgi:hypothetical protein
MPKFGRVLRVWKIEIKIRRKIKNKMRLDKRRAAKLAYLRSDEAAARAVFKLLGDGIIPFTKSGTWMETHRFSAQPARYKTGYGKSIYALVPTNYFTVSPTVKLYGAEFGTDKIAHFFQQGYDYYKIYNRALARGATPDEARKKRFAGGR